MWILLNTRVTRELKLRIYLKYRFYATIIQIVFFLNIWFVFFLNKKLNYIFVDVIIDPINESQQAYYLERTVYCPYN